MRPSITRRGLQICLGLVWILDGGLQFQSVFYSHGFTDGLREGAAGQPGWLSDSITWSANLAAHNLGVWNTLFALVQVSIGLGLLYRPTVKPALAVSFAWVLVVWWVGEAFGMLFMNAAEPLTGAPGGVLLYALIGLLAWPGERAGGLLGARGARIMWASLWLVMAFLWLGPASSGPDSVSNVLDAGGSGMGWLTSLQSWIAGWTAGGGLVVAIVFAILSVAIAIGVATDRWARPLLWVSIAINLVLWVVGQSLGELFAGGATDPNSGPLFILLALAMFPIVEAREEPALAPERADPPGANSGHQWTGGIKMNTQRSRGLGLAMVVALVVAGCGGSGSSSTASVSLKPIESTGGSSEGMSESEMEGMPEGGKEASSEPTEGPTGMLMAPSDAHGTATLEQKGDKLTGTITVSGLEPNSSHAEHLHGPDGSCEPKKMVSNMAVVLPDLKADAKGVATAKVDFTVHQQVVEPGYFIMVHEEPTPAAERNQIGAAPASPAFMQALSKNPGILCGEVEVGH